MLSIVLPAFTHVPAGTIHRYHSKWYTPFNLRGALSTENFVLLFAMKWVEKVVLSETNITTFRGISIKRSSERFRQTNPNRKKQNNSRLTNRRDLGQELCNDFSTTGQKSCSTTVAKSWPVRFSATASNRVTAKRDKKENQRQIESREKRSIWEKVREGEKECISRETEKTKRWKRLKRSKRSGEPITIPLGVESFPWERFSRRRNRVKAIEKTRRRRWKRGG